MTHSGEIFDGIWKGRQYQHRGDWFEVLEANFPPLSTPDSHFDATTSFEVVTHRYRWDRDRQGWTLNV